MPSSSRRLKKLPRGEDPSDSCSSSSSVDNDTSPPPPPPSNVEDSIDRLASVVHHKAAASSTSNEQNEREEEDAASSIAAMSKGLAAGIKEDNRCNTQQKQKEAGDIPEAFVPPPFESRSLQVGSTPNRHRSIQVQIAVDNDRDRRTCGDTAGSSRSSLSGKRDRQLEKSSPITGNDHQLSTSVKPSSSSHRGAQHHDTTPNHPSRVATSAAAAAAASSQRRRQDTSTTTTTPSMSRAAIAPPIVTMETRRNIFDNVDPFRKKKKSKIRFQDDPTGQLYSSSSSELDEETARLKDLFSPPSPSSLRSRRHTNTTAGGMMMLAADDSLQATVTASTSVEASHHDESSPREQVHYPQHQYYSAQHHYPPPPPTHHYPPPPHGYTYESPPTIYVDTARQNDSRGMTLSASRRHNYHGRVVHIPKAKDSSSSSEEDAVSSHHYYGGPGRRRPYKSTPARMSVSRQSIYRRVPQGHPHHTSSTPSTSQRRRHRHDLAMQAEYDSHEDNIQAALQLSFDSQSPDVSPNNNVGSSVGRGEQQQQQVSSSSSQRRQNVHRERNPSPTKKLRANSSGSASSGSGEQQQRYPPSSQQQHHPQHQVQPYPPGYNPYYPYGHPQMMMAVPPGGEGYGYSGHAQWSQQKYPPPPPPGQQGYGGWHPSQQYQQHQFAPPPPTPTGASRRPQQQRTPASKRKKGREVNLKVDTTMETAELSYEDEQHLGLMSPPSSKKKRDATHGLPAEWHSSPPQEFLRNLELDTTPQRGSTTNASSQRERQGVGEGEEEATTPPDGYQIPFTNSFGFGFTNSFGEGFLPTPSAGADQTIFNAASWSPSAMQAFGREFLGPQFSEDSDGLLRPPILRDDDTYSFGTSLSPSQGNSITIRGSPILKKSDRTSKDDDETPAPPPPKEEEEAPEEGCPDDIQHEPPQPQQVRSSPPPPVAHTTTTIKTTTAPKWKTLPKSSSGVGGMRVKIGGGVGMDITEARRGIEGINSVLRGSPVSAPPPKTITASSAPRQKKPKATTQNQTVPPPQTVHPLPQGMADMRINYGSSSVATTHGYAQMPAQPPISTSSGVTQSGLMMMTPVAHTRRGGSGKEIFSKDTGGRTVGPCTCKNSKCLKLYCVCFAAEEYCYGCKCVDCKNTPSHEVIRKEAIVNLKQKNPKAFKTKFTETTNAHASGCRCKKSQCLKKYCECFNSGVTCGEKCKCSNCKNYVGSQALLERRRKMKDFRGVDAAIEASQKAGVTETEPWPPENTSSPVVHHPNRRVAPRTDTKKDSSKQPSSVPRQPPASASSQQQQKHHPQQPQQYQQQQQQMMISPMHQMQFSPPPGYPQQYVQQQYPGMMMQQQQQQYPPGMFYGHPQYALPMKQPVVRTAAYQKRLEDQLRRRAKETKSEVFGRHVPKVQMTVVMKIFSYLDKSDKFNASIVSQEFNKLVDDSLNTGWM